MMFQDGVRLGVHGSIRRQRGWNRGEIRGAAAIEGLTFEAALLGERVVSNYLGNLRMSF
jgi:hypothetical protein